MSTAVAEVSPALEAADLYRFYHSTDDEVFALRGVSISVHPGELVAIVGPSGCGKSTLLNCLAGTDVPDGGAVRIQGQPFTRLSEVGRDRLRGQHIGILLQAANLVEHLNVIENVRLAQALNSSTNHRSAEELLQLVDLAHRHHAIPSTLSGGESSRAGLAIALANRPTILLADEPTGELDTQSEASLITLLQSFVAEGLAAVVVTHSGTMASAAHRVLHLDDGRIIRE